MVCLAFSINECESFIGLSPQLQRSLTVFRNRVKTYCFWFLVLYTVYSVLAVLYLAFLGTLNNSNVMYKHSFRLGCSSKLSILLYLHESLTRTYNAGHEGHTQTRCTDLYSVVSNHDIVIMYRPTFHHLVQ